MGNTERIFYFLAGLAMAGLFFVPTYAGAYEFHPNGWAVPALYGASRISDEMLDFDESVEGAETRLEKFRLPSGARIYRYSHNGNVFAWVVDTDGLDPPEYELVDMDGSGAFEIKQSPYNEYPLPRWTFKPYTYPLAGGGMVRKDWAAGPPSSDQLSMDLYGTGGADALYRRVALNVQFEFDSARLTPEAAVVLDQLGRAMAAHRDEDYQYMIEGHTDARGNETYNAKLSRQRAETVQNYLVSRFGMSADRLQVVGKGESEPIPGTDPNEGVNRRVEIVNLGALKKKEPEPPAPPTASPATPPAATGTAPPAPAPPVPEDRQTTQGPGAETPPPAPAEEPGRTI